ncbi:hypothetical protein A2U01_0076946, partial [Trifolium medium]|nr:hypothetical protein [Trifolium medium]
MQGDLQTVDLEEMLDLELNK